MKVSLKKFLSLLCVLALVFSMGVPAYAQSTGDETIPDASSEELPVTNDTAGDASPSSVGGEITTMALDRDVDGYYLVKTEADLKAIGKTFLVAMQVISWPLISCLPRPGIQFAHPRITASAVNLLTGETLPLVA